MSALLLFLISIIFIGLGIPDSSLGSAWPEMYVKLNLPISYQSFLTLIMSVCTTLSCAFSARVINKFGTGLVTAFSTLLSALSLVGFAISNSMIFLCLFSIPLGLGAGGIDTALNNYVAVRYKPYHMNFLHCFYGIGVSVSPFFMSYALSKGDYKIGFYILFAVMCFLSLIAFIILPLWKKVAERENEKSFLPITVPLHKIAKSSMARRAWVVFFTTCALEFTCGTWGATYLTQTVGLSAQKSASLISLFYIGMTISRVFSGILTTKIKSQIIIFSGCAIIFFGVLILFLPVNPPIKSIGFLLIGLGNGQTFPNLAQLTPTNFGKEYSQSVIGSLMLFSNLGILLTPPLFGIIAQFFGTKILPLFILVLWVLLFSFTALYLNKSKTEKFKSAVEK